MANEVTKTSIDLSPEKGVIIQNVIVRPVQRKSQDIENWRNAIRAAEAIHPVYTSLYDLYEEIRIDGVVKNLIKKLILGVTKTKMKYVDKNGEEVPEMTELIKKSQFRKLRKAVQKQKVFGPTVIELINDEKGFRVYEVPRKNVRPKEGVIVKEQSSSEVVCNYRTAPDNKFILEVGEWNDLGLLLEAAPYVIYKRGGFGDWAEFIQIFGMPFREARYDGFNEGVRKQLEMALEAAGSAAYAILPKDAEFKLHEAGNAQSNGELFNTLRKACNEELAILFLGQTETTQKTAGKLGGNDDTHEQTEDDINSDDKLDELSVFNEGVKPILMNLGLLKVDGEFVYEEQEESIPLKDRIDNVVKLRNDAKLPIEDDYIYEMTGIPKPANYNQLKKEMQQQQEQQQEKFNQDKKEKKDKKKPGDKNNKKLSFKDKFLLAMADFFDRAHKS